MKKETSSAIRADATRAIISGRSSFSHHGVVNTPVYHASTILHPNVESFEKRHDSKTGDRRKVIYGLLGTPTSFDLEEAIADLEGGHDALLTPSGLAAINIALLAFLRPGDHILVADSVYAWTRSFSDQMLSDLGVEVQYYNPLVGADIASLIRPSTRVIFLESPGSYTFEVQDIPAITEVARKHQITTILDNTWATPLFFKSFEHGVDVSVHAATKYLSGHSDVMMGAIVCNEASWEAVHRTHKLFGQCVGPDDAYATLRSVRTLPTRLRARVLSVQASIAVAFFAFILFTSNPFLRLDVPPLNVPPRAGMPLMKPPAPTFSEFWKSRCSKRCAKPVRLGVSLADPTW